MDQVQLIAEIQRKVGRNVLLFQEVEAASKSCSSTSHWRDPAAPHPGGRWTPTRP